MGGNGSEDVQRGSFSLRYSLPADGELSRWIKCCVQGEAWKSGGGRPCILGLNGLERICCFECSDMPCVLRNSQSENRDPAPGKRPR